MADSGLSTKAAKKNAKRRQAKKKKHGGATGDCELDMDPQAMLDILKQQLEQAKAEKMHKDAGVLRDQIWVLQDLIRGVRTDLPDDELDPILERIAQVAKKAEEEVSPSVDNGHSATSNQSAAASQSEVRDLTTEEKRIRTLKKKLQQIDMLKERKQKGETLESSQEEKIQTESKIREELEELEELMNSLSTS